LLSGLILAACAPAMKPGALSPVNARVTNEVLDADQHTLDAWARRVAALGATTTAATPERAYMAARAAAWLGFARDAYAADPRDSTADRALAQTRYLVRALETKTPLPAEGTASIPAGPSASLWGTLDSLRRSGAAVVAPAALAEAEGALVRAAYLASAPPATGTLLVRNAANAARDCDIQLQLTRAEQLVMGLRGNGTTIASGIVPLPVPASTAFSVQLAGEAATPAPSITVRGPTIAMAADTLPPMELVVHFAAKSSALTTESRAALDDVIAGLRAHRAARISFEGYTGKRVGERFDRALAGRRAATVQRYLAAAQLDLARLTVAGRSSNAAPGARDARMMLSFIGADGRSLTLEGVHEQEPKEPPQQKEVVPFPHIPR
jgi:outer membrane protein OmpA-like peptidoglycan-associated protein